MASYGLPPLPGELQTGLQRLYDDARADGHQRAVGCALAVLEEYEPDPRDRMPGWSVTLTQAQWQAICDAIGNLEP